MCTLIASLDGQLILGMNRDEDPVRMHKEYFDQEIFYPIDPLRNGTWIGLSLDGSIAALLNGQGKKGELSRGEIIPYVIRNGNIAEMDLTRYGPFVLFHYDNRKRTSEVFEWDCQQMREYSPSDSVIVMTSSGYGFAKEKKDLVIGMIGNDKITKYSLSKILSSHIHENGILSPCMHGPRSETIASTIITVSAHEAQIYDTVGSPCAKQYVLVKTIKIQ